MLVAENLVAVFEPRGPGFGRPGPATREVDAAALLNNELGLPRHDLRPN
jgi:hypothetical protein